MLEGNCENSRTTGTHIPQTHTPSSTVLCFNVPLNCKQTAAVVSIGLLKP